MKSFRINFLSKLRIMLLTICIQILKNINISLILFTTRNNNNWIFAQDQFKILHRSFEKRVYINLQLRTSTKIPISLFNDLNSTNLNIRGQVLIRRSGRRKSRGGLVAKGGENERAKVWRNRRQGSSIAARYEKMSTYVRTWHGPERSSQNWPPCLKVSATRC